MYKQLYLTHYPRIGNAVEAVYKEWNGKILALSEIGHSKITSLPIHLVMTKQEYNTVCQHVNAYSL